MDNETLMLLAKFTLRARKIVGPIDSSRLTKDETYRSEIFKRIDAEAEEELLLLAVSLRNQLEGQATPRTTPTKSSADKKYILGPRG